MSYSSIIQKDLPLIFWSLDDATLTAGSIIQNDGYLSGYTGTYTAEATKKSIPIVHGSSQSIVVTQNNPTYSLRVPTMDMFSANRYMDNMTLEFWIKFIGSPSASSRTEIMKKNNSETGIYLQNSSIVAVIGDTAGETITLSVKVDNLLKPMHIALVQGKNSVSLIVNGMISSKYLPSTAISEIYTESNEFFNFYYNSSIGKYALDSIAIYTKAMSVIEARRHLAYGIGYEISDSLVSKFGGTRYSLSMLRTPISGKIERAGSSWSAPSTIKNMYIDDKGNLSINNLSAPQLNYTGVEDSTIFSWDATSGLSIAYGGYLSINNIHQLSTNGSGGMSVQAYKATGKKLSDGQESTIMLVSDSTNGKSSLSLRIFLAGTTSGEDLYFQMNGEAKQKLKTFSGSVNGLTGSFVTGYHYDISNNQVKVFYGVSGDSSTGYISQTNSPVNGKSLFPLSNGGLVTLGTAESHSSFSVAEADVIFQGGYNKIIQLDLLSATIASNIYNEITSKINKYTATANSTQKRFIVSSSGYYEFIVDLKRIAGSSSIIGTNVVEWGYDGTEVSITASEISNVAESGWLAAPETLLNRKPFIGIIGVSPGNSKAAKIKISVVCTDVIEVPTKIPFFRIVSYSTTENTGIYTTNIEPIGTQPKFSVKYNSSTADDTVLPAYYSTPFLYDEERGGIKIGYTASIDYNLSVMSGSDATSGLNAVSFFINIDSASDRTIMKIKTGETTNYTMSYSTATSKISVDYGTLYLNGVAATESSGKITPAITTGIWNHITFIFPSRLAVTSTSNPTIEFGSISSTANMYIDEIITHDNLVSTDQSTIFKSLIGTNTYNVYSNQDSSSKKDAEMIILDSEKSNSTNIIQPLFRTQIKLLEPVMAASTKQIDVSSTTYSSSSTITVDGYILKSGDRVLLKNQTTAAENGIYTITINTTDGVVSSIAWTKVSADSGTSGYVTYVSEGLKNADMYFQSTSSTAWSACYTQPKVVYYNTSGLAQRNK